MQFVRKWEVNCFHISAIVRWNYKKPLIFYSISEITVKGKVKAKKQTSKKGKKAALKEAITQAENQGEIPDNMTTEEAKRKEGVMVPDLIGLGRQSRAALGNHVQRYWLGASLNIK